MDTEENPVVTELMKDPCRGHHEKSSHPSQIKCGQCVLKKLCLVGDHYSEWPTQLDDIIIHKRPLQKGKHLYWQDTPFKSIYIVQSGGLKAYRLSSRGRERVLGFYLPGEMVGTDGLFNNRYSNSLMTLETTSVCELPFQPLLKLFEHEEVLLRQFLSIMCGELLEEQQLTLLSHKSTEERVAAFLMNLSARYQKRQLSASRMQLLMTRKDIANYLGIAVETISRVLSRFQDRGWIEINGRDIQLRNFSALEELLLQATN